MPVPAAEKNASLVFTRAHRSPYFRRNEQPSVSLALPPVGWHSTCEQPAHTTTVCAWLKTVVMVKQPGHLTSMKKLRGPETSVCWDGVRTWLRPARGWFV